MVVAVVPGGGGAAGVVCTTLGIDIRDVTLRGARLRRQSVPHPAQTLPGIRLRGFEPQSLISPRRWPPQPLPEARQGLGANPNEWLDRGLEPIQTRAEGQMKKGNCWRHGQAALSPQWHLETLAALSSAAIALPAHGAFILSDPKQRPRKRPRPFQEAAELVARDSNWHRVVGGSGTWHCTC